jgi:hypothetical protein
VHRWPRGNDYLPMLETLLTAGADVMKVALPTGNARVNALLRYHAPG